jgi:K+/H+ antiporter YhaU regulatory subunit KhtT
MRWSGNVAGRREKRNAYSFQREHPKEIDNMARLRRRLENNIKTALKKNRMERGRLNGLTQDRVTGRLLYTW